jgi:hypothetical protein
MEYCEFSFVYKPPKQQSSDSRRVFSENGIEPSRRIMFVEARKMGEMVKKIEDYISDA